MPGTRVKTEAQRPARRRPEAHSSSGGPAAAHIGRSSDSQIAHANSRRALMQRLDRCINGSMGLDSILRATVEELGQHLELDRCVLWLPDSNQRRARPAFQYCSDLARSLPAPAVAVDFDDLAQIVIGRGGLFVTDTNVDPALRQLCDALDSQRPASMICLPVELEGIPRAMLTMARMSEARAWPDADVELGRAIADRLAVAMRQAELLNELRESAREAEALYRASSLLIDTSDIDALYEQILDAVADVFGHPRSNIWLVDEAAGAAVLAYTRGDVPEGTPRSLRLGGPGLIPHAIRSACVINVPNVHADPRYVPGLVDTRAELLVPLIVGHKVIAIFNLESPVEHAFTGRDERILSSFAERAARAVEQARSYTRAQESAAREALISRITRLLNQTIDYEPIFLELVEELGRSLNLDRCFLIEADGKSSLIRVTHQFAAGGVLLEGPFSAGVFAGTYIPPRGRPAVQTDTRSAGAPLEVAEHFASAGIRSFISAAAPGSDLTRLALVCAAGAPRQWRPEDVDLIEVLAAQVGATRERAELFNEVVASQRESENSAHRAAQAEKLRALGQLASGVVHNFNNLLAAILGHAQLLKRQMDPGPLADHVDVIERAAADGASMVRRINNFSISESEEHLAPVDMNQLIRDALEVTRIRWQDDARARGTNYTIEFQPGAVGPLVGNGTELREVFVNIILNALDAMERAGGRLLIQTGVSSNEVFARFTDQGIGMSAEVQERIFDPFFSTKGPAGSGLGLSGSNVAVRRHRGRITVESEPDGGATFAVWLPLRRGLLANSKPGLRRALSSNVILVGGDDAVGERLALLLESRGHCVLRASDAVEAMEQIKRYRGRCRAAIVDLEQQQADRLELARKLKAIDSSIKILLLADAGSALPDGFDDRSFIEAVVASPVQDETLVIALERALL